MKPDGDTTFAPEVRADKVSQVTGNFSRTAHDLKCAFTCGLSRNERIIVDALCEKSWVPAMVKREPGEPLLDAIPATVNFSLWSRMTGADRTRLSKTLDDMTERRILEAIGDGHQVQTDYRLWLAEDKKLPLFNDVQLEFIRGAKRRQMEYRDAFVAGLEVRRGAAVSGDQKCGAAQQSGDKGVRRGAAPPVARRSTPCGAAQQNGGSPTPPVLEREEKKDISPRDIDDTCPPDDGPSVNNQPNSDGSYRGPETPDAATLGQVDSLIKAFLADRGFEDMVRLYRFVYPSSWFLKAIKRTIARKNGQRVVPGYTREILKNWAGGDPDRGPEDEFDDTMTPIVAPAGRQPSPIPAAPVTYHTEPHDPDRPQTRKRTADARR